MYLPRLKKSVVSILLALGAGESLAGGWDCHRSEDGKEWVCVSGKNKPAAPRPEEEKQAKPDEEVAPKPQPRREVARPTPPVEQEAPAEAMPKPVPPPRPILMQQEQVAKPAPVVEPEPQAEEIAKPNPKPRPVPAQREEVAQPEPTPAPVAPIPQPPAPVAKRAAPVTPPVSEPEPTVITEPSPQPGFTPAPAQAFKAPAGKASGTDVKLFQPSPAKAAQANLPPAQEGTPAQTAKTARTSTPLKPGWNCRPTVGSRQWECGLVGADPRGEAHVVGDTGVAAEPWSQSSDMTREDESRFSSIMGHLPSSPWASCGRNKREWSARSDFLLNDADRILRDKSPMEIKADRAEMIKGEASNYEGTAEIVRADQQLYGEFVSHNKTSGVLNAQGNVVYREKGLSFASDTAFMELAKNEGILRNAQFVLETVPARGTARVAHIDSKTKSRYETVTYTSCPPGNQDWLLHATNTTINKETGVGTATNAWVSFKGVPFLYTPYMSFPVDDRRRSGLLTPYIGASKQNGFDFTLPYYLNLAPNYDLTLLPRYLEKRGPMMRSDFRYLTTTSSGRLFLDILPWDQEEHKTRGQVGWVDTSRWTENISSHADLHLISDKRYIFELGNLLSTNTALFLRSWGTVDYTGGNFLGGTYSANLLVDYYQSTNTATAQKDYPYRRMPMLNFNYGRGIGDTGLEFQSHIEATRFEQNLRASGQRLNLRPRILYPFRDSAGYVTPSVTLQHTEYWLDNLQPMDGSNTFSRTAPIVSIDSGAYLERDFDLFDSSMQQTLEPRLFYLYVPKVSQPYQYNYDYTYDSVTGKVKGFQGLNFDSNEYDFNFYQLFRENRFSGYDRLSDANNITPALTTRLITSKNGLERLRLSVGKVFYLKEPSVVLVPNGPQVTYKDNLIGEAASSLSEHWSMRTTGQYNPDFDRMDRAQFILQYNDFSNTLINASYRYRRDPYEGSVPPYPVNPYYPRTINQTDLSTRLPIGGGWYGIGRWQYDIASQVTVQSMVGVEKETCCWRFSLMGLHYINGATGQVVTSNTVNTNNAIFFQFELKGLGRFGDQMDNFLMQNLSGYRPGYDIYSNPNQ